VTYAPVEPISKTHLTDEFDCGSEAQTTWLRKYALQADRTDTTKVQVVRHESTFRVVGYYALSAGSVEATTVPERVRKGLPGYPVPVIILTRLGVDLGEQGKGLGRALVKDAILRAESASHAIGARALLIHCETKAAKDFYRSFIPDFAESPTDPLHLYLLMSDIRATIAPLRQISSGERHVSDDNRQALGI
jgi:GNAT superfamily N-acetyltransferase